MQVYDIQLQVCNLRINLLYYWLGCDNLRFLLLEMCVTRSSIAFAVDFSEELLILLLLHHMMLIKTHLVTVCRVGWHKMCHAHAAFGVREVSTMVCFSQGLHENCIDRAWNPVTSHKHSESVGCPLQSIYYLIKHDMLFSSCSPQPKCCDCILNLVPKDIKLWLDCVFKHLMMFVWFGFFLSVMIY